MNANSNMNINLYKNYITVFTLSMIQNLNHRANGFHKMCVRHIWTLYGKNLYYVLNPLNLSVPYLFFYLSHARQKVDVDKSGWTSLSKHVSNIELYT